MTCEKIREAASARLDGEAIGMSPAVLDAHLRDCPSCAAWVAEATKVTRAARLSVVQVPDLTAAVLDRVTLPSRGRWTALTVRIALAVVGVSQFALAVPAVFGDGIGMAMSMHSAHESAAWNAAVGAGLLAVAFRPRRAAGLVPLLAALVGLLALFSVADVVSAQVAEGRVLTHAGCLIGFALVVALTRLQGGDVPAPAAGHEPARPAEADHLRGVA